MKMRRGCSPECKAASTGLKGGKAVDFGRRDPYRLARGGTLASTASAAIEMARNDP